MKILQNVKNKTLVNDLRLIELITNFVMLKYKCTYEIGLRLVYKDYINYYIGGSDYSGYIVVSKFRLILFVIKNTFQNLNYNIKLIVTNKQNNHDTERKTTTACRLMRKTAIRGEHKFR